MTTRTSSNLVELSASPPVNRRHIVFVLVAVASLALGGVFVRLSEIGPVATGGYRALLAVPVLMAISMLRVRRSGRRPDPMRLREHLLIALGGTFLAADLCLWNISFLYTTLAEANLLANLLPFVVAPISYFMFKERVPAALLMPAVSALIGLYILVLLGTGVDSRHLTGDALALGTAVFYALFLITAKVLRSDQDAIRIMAYLSFYCAAVCFVVAAIRGENMLPVTVKGWAVLVMLALASQILGQTLMAHSVKYLPLQLASLFVLLQPVAATIYARILFSERLSITQLVGIGILMVSIYWAKIILEGMNAPE